MQKNNKEIAIKLGDQFELVAESNTYDGYREINIGLQDPEGYWFQDLAIVGQRYDYDMHGKMNLQEGRYIVRVYDDPDDEDYTYRHEIVKTPGEEKPYDADKLITVAMDDGYCLAAKSEDYHITVGLLDSNGKWIQDLVEVGEQYRFDRRTNEPVQDHGNYYIDVRRCGKYRAVIYRVAKRNDPGCLIPIWWLNIQRAKEQDETMQQYIEELIHRWDQEASDYGCQNHN